LFFFNVARTVQLFFAFPRRRSVSSLRDVTLLGLGNSTHSQSVTFCCSSLQFCPRCLC